ncbi:MAG: DUF4191 domain-containing protein [Propionibacteriaceae bacterium]|nr:DUF4191 domain-containing protein [Micropruina sp.]HBX80345.1 DUF4191 domain-containing protein [Propionibacteriaceae bacterium]HBY22463.1 DUF4191 domain-containing protein [Propionibacteriaceae bacterium]
MASEKAKELARQQKALLKAEKERKRTSTDPKDWNQLKQIREAYKVTVEYDKQLPWLLGGVALASIVLGVVLGVVFGGGWTILLWGITGLMMAAVLCLLLLTNRAKAASYKRYADQPGSAQVALQMLDAKKYSYTAGIAANRNMDLVHRVVGPCGILLIGEGKGAKPLLADQAKKHETVAYGVKVTTVMMGDGDGQVPLPKLADYIKKLPSTLQPSQVNDVKKRLVSLDKIRTQAPLPKGPMPAMKGSMRRAMRGR